MHRFLLAILVSSACASEHHIDSLTDHRDSWTTVDKREHFAGGLVIGAVGTLMADELMPNAKPWVKVATGIALSAVFGAIKEVSDYQSPRRHDCSLKDFAATTAGGVLGSVSVSVVFRF